jgi:hypothetical protein
MSDERRAGSGINSLRQRCHTVLNRGFYYSESTSKVRRPGKNLHAVSLVSLYAANNKKGS